MSRPVRPGAGAPRADSPNLAAIPAAFWRAWLAGYSEGVEYGYGRALDDQEAADDAVWAELSRRVRAQARSPRYSQLCDRRGDHVAAGRARDCERRNGLDLAG